MTGESPPETADRRRVADTSVDDPRDDACLVVAAIDDPATFATLYRRYVSRVYAYLARQTGNAEDAEDLTAITFSKVLAGLSNYREQGNFAAWLFSIARHSLHDHRRRRRSRVDIEQLVAHLADPAPSTEGLLLQAEEARRLHRLIENLPGDQREVVILRFFGELRSAEIGRVLGRSEGAVRMLLHRSIKRLRRAYAREDAP
jgi:RNA polymerase sigma-70 factor, ECF subfamily